MEKTIGVLAGEDETQGLEKLEEIVIIIGKCEKKCLNCYSVFAAIFSDNNELKEFWERMVAKVHSYIQIISILLGSLEKGENFLSNKSVIHEPKLSLEGVDDLLESLEDIGEFESNHHLNLNHAFKVLIILETGRLHTVFREMLMELKPEFKLQAWKIIAKGRWCQNTGCVIHRYSREPKVLAKIPDLIIENIRAASCYFSMTPFLPNLDINGAKEKGIVHKKSIKYIALQESVNGAQKVIQEEDFVSPNRENFYCLAS